MSKRLSDWAARGYRAIPASFRERRTIANCSCPQRQIGTHYYYDDNPIWKFGYLERKMMPTTMQLITLFSACAGVFLWWKLPNIQRRELLKKYEEKVATGDIKELDLEKLADDYRKTVTQAITAALLLVSATVAFQQMENGRKESDQRNKTRNLRMGSN